MSHNPLTYKDAGVDIQAGEDFVARIKPIAAKTKRPEVLAGLGGFAALCELPKRYREPVLVSGADGVGTKLKLAIELNQHDTIGIDLVAMCVNDVIVQGAEPLFFLDYFATAHLQVETAVEVMRGIGQGCEQAGCALIGGETAEMPGMYSGEDYDLAGFCVGVVEKSKILNGQQSKPGDVLLALASSGLHSNGFSLVRKIITTQCADLKMPFHGKTLGAELLTPTRIYVKSILKLLQTVEVRGLAHITGGGILENLPRVLPQHIQAVINLSTWERPPIFRWLQAQGNIAEQEMLKTFNCGVGMIICVKAEDVETSLAALRQSGETAWTIGELKSSSESNPSVNFVTSP